jgi:hypothetical protein
MESRLLALCLSALLLSGMAYLNGTSSSTAVTVASTARAAIP